MLFLIRFSKNIVRIIQLSVSWGSLWQPDNQEKWHGKRMLVVQMSCLRQTISWWRPHRCRRIVAGVFRVETDVCPIGSEIWMLDPHHQAQA